MKYLPMMDKRFTGLKFAGGKVNVSFLYGSIEDFICTLASQLSPINISVVAFIKNRYAIGLHVSWHEKINCRKCA